MGNKKKKEPTIYKLGVKKEVGEFENIEKNKLLITLSLGEEDFDKIFKEFDEFYFENFNEDFDLEDFYDVTNNNNEIAIQRYLDRFDLLFKQGREDINLFIGVLVENSTLNDIDITEYVDDKDFAYFLNHFEDKLDEKASKLDSGFLKIDASKLKLDETKNEIIESSRYFLDPFTVSSPFLAIADYLEKNSNKVENLLSNRDINRNNALNEMIENYINSFKGSLFLFFYDDDFDVDENAECIGLFKFFLKDLFSDNSIKTCIYINSFSTINDGYFYDGIMEIIPAIERKLEVRDISIDHSYNYDDDEIYVLIKKNDFDIKKALLDLNFIYKGEYNERIECDTDSENSNYEIYVCYKDLESFNGILN